MISFLKDKYFWVVTFIHLSQDLTETLGNNWSLSDLATLQLLLPPALSAAVEPLATALPVLQNLCHSTSHPQLLLQVACLMEVALSVAFLPRSATTVVVTRT